jgi:hypothetical protein
MRALAGCALALALTAVPAHAGGRNSGAFHGTQGYQDGETSFSVVVTYAGPDGADQMSCTVAGEAAFDGTTERGTLPGVCASATGQLAEAFAAELTYLKTGFQFSGHLEWTRSNVVWAAGLSGFAVATSDVGVALAGTARVYLL